MEGEEEKGEEKMGKVDGWSDEGEVEGRDGC